jgi:hypothetical protein
VIGNEEESGDPGAAGVEVNVCLDVELVSADDLTVVGIVVVAIGVDFVDVERGSIVVGVHV